MGCGQASYSQGLRRADLLAWLERAIHEHGAPAFLRGDNGPEFIAKEVQRWLADHQIYSIGTYFVELEFTNTEHSAGFFLWSERAVAALFTIEYFARWVASRSLFYPLRLNALVDLVAILPFYIGFLVDLRALRLVRTLRILRLLKLYRYSAAFQNIRNAFVWVRYEFGIIGFAVFTVGWVSSVAIYELERDRQPEVFGHLSDAMWYVVVMLTTVGYGDKIPLTGAGRFVAVCTMVVGLGLFGTFVSLVGGAFLEEVRQKRLTPSLNPVQEDHFLPEQLQVMAVGSFNPEQILRAIDDGVLSSPPGLVHLEAVRLLTVACHTIQNDRRPSSQLRQS